MPYARFDDRWDDHKKIKRALRREPAAVAMHAMAITYCNRHNSDGEIDADWVEERLALMPYKPAQRKRVLNVLLELNLFEQHDSETFIVHDYLDWNLSRKQREQLAVQGRRGGRSPRGLGPPGSQGSSRGLSDGSSESSSQGSSPPGNSGLSTPTPRHATPRQEEKNDNAELRSAVVECFVYWQEKCGHKQARLTEDRKAKILARLREGYTVADIHQGIDGAARAAFVDEKGKRFDDIELICRKGSKLEDFMARAALPNGNVVAMGQRRESASDWIKAINGEPT